MVGKLTRNDKQQLEDWMKSGPKDFTLLYSATRDGCSNTSFHQKCDNQGPTVTVLYNRQGTVYGGYTGVSWSSCNNGYMNSGSEFLFRLYSNGTLSPLQFPLKISKASNGIYNHTDNGPTFGAGHDLETFTDTIDISGGSFALNGSMTIGNTYDVKGLTVDDINDDTMDVTELEVYRVAAQVLLTSDREPWRKVVDWNKEVLYSLKTELQSFTPLKGVDVTNARLVLIGPVGAGKSSFFNSVDSVFTGHITQKACSGSAEQSVSSMYIPYRVRTNERTPKFRICDTPGLEESQGLDSVEFNYLLEGNIPDYYELNPISPLKPSTLGFKVTPTLSDKVHCIIFVLDATTLDALSTKFLEKIKQFKVYLYRKGVPHMVLLTKIDKLCKDVKQDITNLYKSEVVQEHVEKTADLLGIPPLNIHPMKNYVSEVECDIHVGIVVLRAIQHALNCANSFLQVYADRTADANGSDEI